MLPSTFWANGWYTNECSIEIGAGRGRQWIWRHGGEAWLPQHMAFRALNKQTIMIWAGMRADGRIVWCFTSDYYENETTMNSVVYARMLADFLPQMYEPGQFWLQDNSRVHTAIKTRNLMMDYGVWWLPNPPRSPDLNPIEHFWLRLKEAVHRIHPELISMQGGKEKLIAVSDRGITNLEIDHD